MARRHQTMEGRFGDRQRRQPRQRLTRIDVSMPFPTISRGRNVNIASRSAHCGVKISHTNSCGPQRFVLHLAEWIAHFNLRGPIHVFPTRLRLPLDESGTIAAYLLNTRDTDQISGKIFHPHTQTRQRQAILAKAYRSHCCLLFNTLAVVVFITVVA
jgi:hypothetical protein